MRPEKQLLLSEIKEKIDGSTALIVTSYSRLQPNVSWKFRDVLAKSGSSFEVVRKRVFLKAAEQAGMKIDESLLEGHIGVVFVNQPDAMNSAKAVYKFSDENTQLLKVICAQVDGKFMPGAEMEMLSKLPGIDEMRAIMLGLLVSPMSHMLSVLEAKIAAEPATDQQS